ncbi:MAG TPA: XdhC family protein [Pyrinomonadaceae bacterium]|nr:XdhC family protein [Pyrinomonadaceae bacterium]
MPTMILVVAESSGSSPGRKGYKMAVAADGELVGSIGGGIMEVNLVEQSREILGAWAAAPPHGGIANAAERTPSFLLPQVHQKNAPNSSGMICSGRQTVIFKLLAPQDLNAVQAAWDALLNGRRDELTIAPSLLAVGPPKGEDAAGFEKFSDADFLYRERLGPADDLYIIGGGHCALALSELMSKLDFHIHLFDDRPNLNTLEKNRFADEITVIESYDEIADHMPSSPEAYVVVMTLGYLTDAVVIKKLLDKEFKYFGVLGSKAKMATLLRQLKQEGYPEEKLNQLHTPIGIPINSHTPEEIAVSIAAEIIVIKNAD